MSKAGRALRILGMGSAGGASFLIAFLLGIQRNPIFAALSFLSFFLLGVMFCASALRLIRGKGE